jgi:hypothetical protein
VGYRHLAFDLDLRPGDSVEGPIPTPGDRIQPIMQSDRLASGAVHDAYVRQPVANTDGLVVYCPSCARNYGPLPNEVLAEHLARAHHTAFGGGTTQRTPSDPS